MPDSLLEKLLAAAVANLGGEHRPGQAEMANAVQRAFLDGKHLLVQAGTGTGKSLAYLIPALLQEKRVVVATATLALQHQLVSRDLPKLLAGIAKQLPRPAKFAVLKGRNNYACLYRVNEGGLADEDQGELIETSTSGLGAEVIKLREWVAAEAKTGGTGDRDFAPSHSDMAWRQVSVSSWECHGSKCTYFTDCFAEQAREIAQNAQLVITNHSILAIDAAAELDLLPEHELVIVDEAHELPSRVTQSLTDELSVAELNRVARQTARWARDAALDLTEAADDLRLVLAELEPIRIEDLSVELAEALHLVQQAVRKCSSEFSKDTDNDPVAFQAKQALQQIFTKLERILGLNGFEVLWLSRRERGGDQLCIAPLQVNSELRQQLFAEKTVVLTSATLKTGGDFAATAASLGLPKPASEHWVELDVGSPFNYQKQGILYLAAKLPPPGREQPAPELITEILELIEASGGRTLGLFSSHQALVTITDIVREKLPFEVLRQGEAQLPELVAKFANNPESCLFGTLSLWQGVDVPGPSCQLVLIDRLPFPRPDDPLMSARQRAAEKAGRNGFMSVAAPHAGLLLAQAAGRLIRTVDDQGVVAVLDPRLATARYGNYLKAGLPEMWTTQNPETARAALRRLRDAATPQ